MVAKMTERLHDAAPLGTRHRPARVRVPLCVALDVRLLQNGGARPARLAVGVELPNLGHGHLQRLARRDRRRIPLPHDEQRRLDAADVVQEVMARVRIHLRPRLLEPLTYTRLSGTGAFRVPVKSRQKKIPPLHARGNCDTRTCQAQRGGTCPPRTGCRGRRT